MLLDIGEEERSCPFLIRGWPFLLSCCWPFSLRFRPSFSGVGPAFPSQALARPFLLAFLLKVWPFLWASRGLALPSGGLALPLRFSLWALPAPGLALPSHLGVWPFCRLALPAWGWPFLVPVDPFLGVWTFLLTGWPFLLQVWHFLLVGRPFLLGFVFFRGVGPSFSGSGVVPSLSGVDPSFWWFWPFGGLALPSWGLAFPFCRGLALPHARWPFLGVWPLLRRIWPFLLGSWPSHSFWASRSRRSFLLGVWPFLLSRGLALPSWV